MASGYYIDGSINLVVCSDGCAKCTTSSTCTTCKDGYAKIGSSQTCTKCDSSCETCNGQLQRVRYVRQDTTRLYWEKARAHSAKVIAMGSLVSMAA
eukprot:XP_001705636.1 Surface protein [Giardia lamblia ATCC 50803]